MANTQVQPYQDHQKPAISAERRRELIGNLDLSLQQALARAELYITTNLLPKSLDTPEKALLVIMQGRELGIPEMVALRNIYIVNNAPAYSAKLSVALAERDGNKIIPLESDDEHAKYLFIRKDGHRYEHEVTMAEAIAHHWHQVWKWDDYRNKIGHWEDKDNWRNFPAAMLRAACARQGIVMGMAGSVLNIHGATMLPDDFEDDSMIVDAGDGMPTVESRKQHERDTALIATPRNNGKTLFKDEAPRAKPAPAPTPEEPLEGEFHEPVPSSVLLPDMPEQDEPHWIDAPQVRAKFWAWTTELGLKESEVYDALGVEHIHDFHGSKDDAVKMIRTWATEYAKELEARWDAQKAAQPELISDQEAE